MLSSPTVTLTSLSCWAGAKLHVHVHEIHVVLGSLHGELLLLNL